MRGMGNMQGMMKQMQKMQHKRNCMQRNLKASQLPIWSPLSLPVKRS